MALQIKAYPEEYNELAAEMEALRSSITSSLDEVNAHIAQKVSKTGPLYSQTMSAKITNLLACLRLDFHAQNASNMELMAKHLCGFTAGLDFSDKA